jgi:hypothetical protein
MAKILKLKIPTMKLVDASNVTYDVLGAFYLTRHTTFNSTTIEKLKSQYRHYDVFQSRTGDIDSPIHYHDDEEVRVIIRGNPTFYIVSGDYLYIVSCTCLDQLELAPNVLHWFNATGELLVFRFFSKNTSHVMHIPEVLPEHAVYAKNYIDINGLDIKY